MKQFAAFIIVCVIFALLHAASDWCAKRQCTKIAEATVGLVGLGILFTAIYWLQQSGWMPAGTPLYPGGGE